MQQIVISIKEQHPSLAGHFPGRPVVPAVVLLTELSRALEQPYPDLHIRGVRQAKFLKPVLPGELIQVQLEPGTAGIRFQAYRDNVLVFSGEFSNGPASQ